MNIYNHILSEEEKTIIENHFINNGENSKKYFEEFTINTINKYSLSSFDLKHKWRKPPQKNIDYSINLIWDKETNTTAMMYCFSHSKFLLSNAKWRHFKTFNGDVNFQNNNGQTALMCLSSTPCINKLNSDADDFIINLLIHPLNFDLSKKDNQDKTFHIYFFERYLKQIPTDCSVKTSYSFIRKVKFLEKIISHWIDTVKNNDKEKILFVAETALSISSFVKKINFKANTGISKTWLLEANRLEKLGQSLELEGTMNINIGSNKRNKI